MEEAFVELLRFAETSRVPGLNVYFECSRAQLQSLKPAQSQFPNPVAALWGFPVCINDQLRKPRLVIEPIHVGENS